MPSPTDRESPASQNPVASERTSGEFREAIAQPGTVAEARTHLYAAVQTICKSARERLLRAGATPVPHVGIRLLARDPAQDGAALLGEEHFERLVTAVQPVLTAGGPSHYVLTTPGGEDLAEVVTFDTPLRWTEAESAHIRAIGRAPSGGLHELLARVAAIEEHRAKRAEEFEGPVNALLATYPELNRKGVQDLAAGLNSILVTAGLAIVCPSYAPNQSIPPGTPCALKAKPSRNSAALVLKAKEVKVFKTKETPTLVSLSRQAGRSSRDGLLSLKLMSFTSLPGLSKATSEIFT